MKRPNRMRLVMALLKEELADLLNKQARVQAELIVTEEKLASLKVADILQKAIEMLEASILVAKEDT